MFRDSLWCVRRVGSVMGFDNDAPLHGWDDEHYEESRSDCMNSEEKSFVKFVDR